MKKIIITILLILSFVSSYCQFTNAGTVANKGFLFPSVSHLSDITLPIPKGLIVVSTEDSMTHVYDGTVWHVVLDSNRIAMLDYNKTQSDARYLQSFTEVDPVFISDSLLFLKKTTAASLYQPVGSYALQSTTVTINGVSHSLASNSSFSVGTLNGSDTVSLSNRINTKLNISDTSAMLSSYGTAIGLKLSITSAAAIYEPKITASNTINKYWNGYKSFVSLNTDSVIEGSTNLYFTNARALAAIPKAKADNATFGIMAADSVYFKDNGSGVIRFSPTNGNGTIASNAVTVNEPKGKLTYNSPSILAAGVSSITFTNSLITSTSIVSVGINGNGVNLTSINCYVKSQTAGSCVINIQNLSLLSLFNSNMVIDYLVIN